MTRDSHNRYPALCTVHVYARVWSPTETERRNIHSHIEPVNVVATVVEIVASICLDTRVVVINTLHEKIN